MRSHGYPTANANPDTACKAPVYPLTRSVNAIAESVEKALADSDNTVALEIISDAWPSMVAQHGQRLRTLIKAIPETHWEHDPWIIAALGASYRSAGSPSRSAALPYFELAETVAASRTEPYRELPAVLLHHSAGLRSVGRLDKAGQKAETASTLLRLALGLSEHSPSRADQLECLGALAYASYASGDFERADKLIARARNRETDFELHGSVHSAPSLIAEILIAVDRNQAGEARSLEAALAASAHRSDWEPLAYYARAATAAINGQLIEALDLQRRSVAAAREWEGEPEVRELANTLRAALYRHLGETGRAARLAAEIRPTQDHVACPACITAGIRLDAGDARGCLDALNDCLTSRDTHSERTMVTALLLCAAASYELAETVSADLAFDQALYIGYTTGIRVPFLVVPRIAMLRMLGRAADRYQPDGVQRLLNELRVTSASSGEIVEPLSERELDIAQHLFQDKTVNQIAAELYISANTVKTHVRSIYRKLAATNRKEAVKRVHELGLDVKITPF